MRVQLVRRKAALLSAASAFSLAAMLVATPTAPASATVRSAPRAAATGSTSSSLGTYAPTYVGPAATGCASNCNLLYGPVHTPSTASMAPAGAASARNLPDRARAVPQPRPGRVNARAEQAQIPTVSCQPMGPGCDSINSSSGGATGVKGLNAVDSASMPTNAQHIDIEPPDQGLCAGNGYVVETNNIGEILVFNTSLARESSVIPLDTVMGLTSRNWSSAGDPSCLYDYSNGGHWFFTEIVSASPESTGGPFSGCFAAKAKSCLEGIAVTVGNNPFGPYNVYYLNANYNPAEPGSPYLLNDFAKIAVSRDAFLLFYDEFPLNPAVAPGFGGGFFNGAQEFAFDKTALETGMRVRNPNGAPNPAFTVARENMGLIPTPNGTCFSDDQYQEGGVTCWYSVIPAQPPDPTQYDNSHGGSAFMADTLDFYGTGDNRLAVWAWTGLSNLSSFDCNTCSGIHFSGQLFSGLDRYYDPSAANGSGPLAPQKAGPIPLGDECGQAGLSTGSPPPATCPENGIQTNGDNITQMSQAQGALWAGVNTQVVQTYASESSTPELHQGALYFVVGTGSFDSSGKYTLDNQQYVSAAHEEVDFPAFGAEGYASDGGDGLAVMSFTLSGNGGPLQADGGGFYPSSAYGTLSATSNGLLGSVINIADLGQSPQDGFTEYQGYPAPTRPRWGDYGAAIFLPGTQRVYFASEYIQYPNCMPPAFTLTVGTCGGTRDGFANWGTSVNYVVP